MGQVAHLLLKRVTLPFAHPLKKALYYPTLGFVKDAGTKIPAVFEMTCRL